MLMMAALVNVSAQSKKVSVLGDSYSTFTGIIPANYATFYPNDRNDVKEVEQTWWNLYIKAKTMYWKKMIHGAAQPSVVQDTEEWIHREATSFLAWIVLAIPTSSLFSEVLTMLGRTRPWVSISIRIGQKTIASFFVLAKICCILNSELREPINESMREICTHYQVQLVELHDIEKQNGHPSIKGMKSICEQLLEAGL